MLLELTQVSKIYRLGGTEINALDEVDFAVKEGEFVAVMGPSGSGKSTLLQVASMLAEPTSGVINLKGKDVTKYDEVQRARLRNKEIGFIFQQFNLLPRTSALDNVRLPLLYSENRISESRQIETAKRVLSQVNLSDRLNNSPAQLSGGQQQRVAIARALVNDPSIIFADEPTGNLDSKTGDEIMELLLSLNKNGKTIIMVTHEDDIAQYAQRLVHFKDGRVIFDKATKKSAKNSKSTAKTKNRNNQSKS